MPLITNAVAQVFQAALDFEPRTMIWLLIVGSFIGFFVFMEKLLEERHPTGSGVFGICRHVVGLIDVTLYYNLMLHVGIVMPFQLFPNIGYGSSGPILYFNTVSVNILFGMYLVAMGALIYGGYILNFTRYLIQMGLGYKLVDE